MRECRHARLGEGREKRVLLFFFFSRVAAVCKAEGARVRCCMLYACTADDAIALCCGVLFLVLVLLGAGVPGILVLHCTLSRPTADQAQVLQDYYVGIYFKHGC